jgi:hypothetical protein
MKKPTPPHAPYLATRQPISRRHFLRGTGIALGLPLLDAMLPTFGRAAAAGDATQAAKPRRMFAICNNLGLLERHFAPQGSGPDYVPSEYLQLLQEHRSDFTVFMGVHHPNVDGAHKSDQCFLTAAPHPGAGSFRNTISLDQLMAEKIGLLTRFPSLTLGVNTRETRSCSYTGNGVAIPPQERAADVFKQLFLQGTPEQIEAEVRKLDSGRSMLDAVAEQTKRFEDKGSRRDRERMDQYFTSVRTLEKQMQTSQGWEYKPKPVVNTPAPVDPTSPAQYLEKLNVLYRLAQLAFETDSTRAITLFIDSAGSPVLEVQGATITESYHNLSHHGQEPDRMGQLKAIELSHLKLLAKMYADFKAVKEGEDTLLERTMLLYGSNFGNSNTHETTNLPMILAGGGFRHGQVIAFDRYKNVPLSNLFVSMLHRLGINVDKFGSSTGTLRGLEPT